jgi:hypothetical protein
MERANLFLIPLDEERRWWRYHNLFADLLRVNLQRLYPARVAELHRNAASWYERHELPAEATRGARAGCAPGAAVTGLPRRPRCSAATAAVPVYSASHRTPRCSTTRRTWLAKTARRSREREGHVVVYHGRPHDVTPLRLAHVPRTEHAGRGSSFPLTGSGSRGGPRGVWSPRSAPLLRRVDWPSRTGEVRSAAVHGQGL